MIMDQQNQNPSSPSSSLSENLMMKIKSLLVDPKQASSSQQLFHHQTTSERYLTSCCCLLLAFQEQEQQEQQQEQHHKKQKDLVVFPKYRENIRCFLDEYPVLRNFMYDLIQTRNQHNEDENDKANTHALYITYERIGLQLLHYYYAINENVDIDNNCLRMDQTESPIISIQHDWNEWQRDFVIIYEMLSNQMALCNKKGENDFDVCDAELVQLVTLMLKNYIYFTTTKTSYDFDKETSTNDWMVQNKWRIIKLASVVFEYYFQCYFIPYYQQKKERDEKTTNIENENVGENDTSMMILILKSILDRNKEDLSRLETFELTMIQFFNHYFQFIQMSSNILFPDLNEQTKSIHKEENQQLLSTTNLRQMIQVIIYHTSPTNLSPDEDYNNFNNSSTYLWFHLSILQIINVQITTSPTINGIMGNELTTSIQKLVLFNLSSSLDYRSFGAIDDVNNKAIILKIRTLTLSLVSTLMVKCGIDWMFSGTLSDSFTNDKSSSSILGQASSLCAILRFNVGELRLSMGEFIDLRFQDKEKEDPELNRTFLVKVQSCIQISLTILEVMLEIASDCDEEGNNTLVENKLPLSKINSDAILHIKHSLDDMLDSTVQFLLEDSFPMDFVWKQSALQCCRYIGCYLSEEDIFEYDDGTDSIHGPEVDESNSTSDPSFNGNYPQQITKTKISSHHLFVALKNGLKLIYDIYVDTSCCEDETGIKGFNVVTLLPCISVILDNVDGLVDTNESVTNRHIEMIRRYILDDRIHHDVLINLLCSVMDNTLKTFRGDEDNIIIMTWCNKVIGCLFNFMLQSALMVSSAGDNRPLIDQNDETRVLKIYRSMFQWIESSSSYDEGDFLHGVFGSITQSMNLNLMTVCQFMRSTTLSQMKGIDTLLFRK